MSDDQALASSRDENLHLALQDVAGQLAPRLRRIYANDATVFAQWMLEQGLIPRMLTKSDMVAYRVYLQEHYKETTASRMLSVARRLLDEQVDQQQLARNLATNVKGFRGEDETPHIALTGQEAQALLDTIDIKTLLGQRDYVLILFLLRTGIRRMEAAALRIKDLTMELSHHVAIVQHGKGNKSHTVKVPVEVWRELEAYLEIRRLYHAQIPQQQLAVLEQKWERGQIIEEDYQAHREYLLEQCQMSEDDGLFVRIRRGNHPTRQAMTDKAIELVVKQYATQISVEKLRPHGLRASFITLTLEAGATLHQVQHAVNHADPRTTLRYQKRKLNLDHNAVDMIHFLKKQ